MIAVAAAVAVETAGPAGADHRRLVDQSSGSVGLYMGCSQMPAVHCTVKAEGFAAVLAVASAAEALAGFAGGRGYMPGSVGLVAAAAAETGQ